MFGIFSSRNEYRLIDEGRVSCPLRRREVELDLCGACGWARAVDPDAPVPHVRCRADAARMLPDVLLV